MTDTVSTPPASPAPLVTRQKRPAIVWDTVLSIVLLAVELLVVIGMALASLISTIFIDYCPAATCSADDAVTAVFGTWAVVTVVGLTAAVLTVVRLVKRRIAWPFAAVGFVLVLAIWVFGESIALHALGTQF